MKHLLLLLVVSCISHVAKSCGGGDYEYEYKFLFSSDLLSDQSLVKYFPDWVVCDDCADLVTAGTIDEWKQRFPNCSDADIKRGLFESLTEENLKQLQSGTNPFPENSFYSTLLANNSEEYIAYLQFVFKENALVTATVGEYSWQDEKKEPEKFEALISEAKQNLSNAKDLFLQQRYIFQLVKLLHIIGKYEEAINQYESYYTTASHYPQQLIYYRTMGYYAGSKRKSGDIEHAKYLFAKIFDESLSLRYRAYKDFKYIDQESEQWQKSLSFAKTNAEKSAMLIAKNIYDFEIDVESLRNLYTTDSTSTRLELALIKQLNNFHFNSYINQLEDKVKLEPSGLITEFTIGGEIITANKVESENWLSRIWATIVQFFKTLFSSSKEGRVKWEDTTPEVNYEPFVYQAEWIPELIGLLSTIIKEKKVKNQDLYVLTKGYLEVVSGQFASGQKTLVGLTASKQPEIVKLAEYVTLWSRILSDPSLTAELENRVVGYSKKHSASCEMLTELGRRYFVEKQFDKAAVVLRKCGVVNLSYNLSEEELAELIKRGNNKLPKPFEEYFGKVEVSHLKEEYARKLFLQGRFEEASKINNSVLDHLKGQDIKYSDLAKWEKQGTLNSYKKIAQFLSTSTFLFYNSTPCYNYYPGYYRASNYPFNVKGLAETIENRNHYIGKLSYSTDLAESYYRKISELSKTDEEKAEALVEAQKIAMWDKYVFKDLYEKEGNQIDKGGYYKELKEKYPNTAIVQELNNSCSFMKNEEITYY